MDARRQPLLCLAAAAALLATGLPAAPARSLDWDRYAGLLQQYTRAVPDIAGTRVDYAGLRKSEAWRKLVDGLASDRPERLEGADARLAYWIDVYNILAIDLVVRGRPERSIRDLGSWWRPVWKQAAGTVGGRQVSLDEIEHGILRPMGDPRVHGAIVCASLSCPPLAREPYRAGSLDAQLDANLRRWLADPRKGLRIDRKEHVVWLSRVFDWFAGDFAAAGGVLAFVGRYAPPDESAWLARHGADATIRFLEYDWRLNTL
jgi:hypothetical protein